MQISVIVPTKHRAAYLEVALRSLAPQVRAHGGELLVVDDGPSEATRRAAEAAGADYVAHERSLGLNAARNTGIAQTTGELVCFVDDDVEVRDGWLAALVHGASRYPDDEVFTGPIVARFDGYRPRFCGREGPPVTSLDHGPDDAVAPHAWGANMTVRRSAIARVGPFDASLGLYGDEQEWQDRLHAAGGRIRYLAGAVLDHRRAGADARVSALARAARSRGRAARREDVAKGAAPPLAAELRVLAGTLLHGPRFGCANGPILTAHTVGRLEEALRPSVPPQTPDFLSGRSGHVAGRRAAVRRALDVVLDAAWRRGPRPGAERRRVLVLGIERPGKLMEQAVAELRRSHHDVTVATTGVGDRGKFQNLNALLAEHAGALAGADWLLVIDDDVELPSGFLDRFLAQAERAGLRLAQPAHRLGSHAAWPVTRRRPGSLVRTTSFVEIGPVTAFRRDTFATLLPFPDLRMGWGLDLHWAAVARERGWPIGVVDATPILHTQPVGVAYGMQAAEEEARAFLAGRPYVTRDEAARTLRTWR
jgi:GT2 family glycosyltransferase